MTRRLAKLEAAHGGPKLHIIYAESPEERDAKIAALNPAQCDTLWIMLIPRPDEPATC